MPSQSLVGNDAQGTSYCSESFLSASVMLGFLLSFIENQANEAYMHKEVEFSVLGALSKLEHPGCCFDGPHSRAAGSVN